MISSPNNCRSDSRYLWTGVAYSGFVIFSFVSLVLRVNGYPIYPSYPPLILCIAIGVISSVRRNRIRVPKYDDVLVLGIGLFPFLLSPFARNSELARESALIFIYFSAAYLITKSFLSKGVITITSIISALMVAFYIILIIGTLQAVTGTPIGLIANYFGSGSSEGAYHSDLFRVSATMTSPNVFANCLVFLLPAGLHSLTSIKKSQSIILALLMFIVIVFLLFSSGSRAGLVYFVFSGLCIYMVWLRKDHAIKNRWLTGFVLLLIFSTVAYSIMTTNIFNNTVASRFFEATDSGRLSTYRAAFSILGDPKIILTGVGGGQFFNELYHKNVLFEYQGWKDPRDIYSTVHNWMLQILSELGIITFFVWILFIISVFRCAVYVFGRDNDILFFMLGINFVILFLVPLQVDTSISNPSVLTAIAVTGAVIVHRSKTLEKSHDA